MDENNQTSQEILEQLRVQTDAVNSLAGVFAKTMTKEQREQWMLEQNVKRTGSAFDKLGGSLHELSEAEKARIAGEKEAAAATNAMKNAVAASTKGLINLSSTLSNTSADLTKWGSTIGGVGDVAMSVGKHFGVLGNTIGGVIKGFSVMAPMLLDQTQKMLKAFDSLSEMGGTTNMTTDQVRELGRASGYTVDNLDKFVNSVKIVGKDINALGVNSAEGTKLFGKMTAVGEKNIQAYNRLGISQEQLTEAQAMYVKQNANAGIALAKSPKELQKASLEYVDQLVKLKELTGMSIKESQAALDQAMAQENFNAYLHTKSMERAELLSRAEKESDPIRQKELKARAEQIDQVIASKKELAAWSTANESARDSTALLQSISRDSAPVYTQANAHFLTAGRNIEGVADRLNKGQSALRDYQGEISKSADNVRKTMGESMYAYGDASKKIQESMGVDNQARKNAARFMESQTEEGRKRIAAEDKATQEQIERRKKQGEILDESGKPMRDGAKDTENTVLSLERALRGLKDDLLGALNPFTKSTLGATAASTALAAAAGYAAFKLGKLGAGGLGDIGDVLKKGLPGTAGPTGGGAPKMPGGLSPDEFKKYEALRKGGMTASEAQRQAGGFKSLVKAETAITGAKTVATAAPVAATAAGGAGTAATAATGAASALSRLAGPLAGLSKAAPLIGTVMSVGTGVVDAYQGIKKADKDLKEGKITKEEARVEKGEAVGGGAGSAIGGTAGALKGAAAGAAIGSVVPVLGTAVGGIIGAALGGWLGSKAGKTIGEVAGGSIAKMTSDADKKVDEASKKAEAKKENVLEKDSAKAKNDPVKVSIVKVEDPNLMKSLSGMMPGSTLSSPGTPGAQMTPAKFTTDNKDLGNKLAELEKQREQFDKKGPATDSAQSKLAHKQILQQLDRAIAAEKAKSTSAKTSVAESSEKVTTKAESAAYTESKSGTNTKLFELQKQRDEFESRGPATESAQSKLAHKNILQQMDRAIANEKAKANAPKAAVGGIFDGPKSGYPVELHGKEAIVPLGTGAKTSALSAPTAGLEDERDEELEKEIEAIAALKKTMRETDASFDKLSTSIIKLNKLEEEKLESTEDQVDGLKGANDKLKDVFRNVGVDLTKFTSNIKFATQESGSGTGVKMPDIGGILGGGSSGRKEAPAGGAEGGTGVKPPSAPPLASMGGGTGIKPAKDQDIKQNLGDVKAALMKRGMTDEKYLNAVLGNVMKESGGKIVNEKLDYSKTSNERIRSIFGSRAAGKTDAELNQIKSSEEGMGEFMYGKDTKIGRSMGNLEPGDGFKYRGRGYIQLTGKNNYAQASQAVFGDDRLVKDPDLLNDPKVAAEVVAWYMERGKTRMATAMGIDEKNMSQDQANLLATSQIAGGDVRKKGAYLSGEVMNKVTAYAGSKDIQGIQPSSGGTMVASADTKKSEIPKAQRGGVFEGPDSGYLVELHGSETVIPNDKIASIAKTSIESSDMLKKIMPSGIATADSIMPATAPSEEMTSSLSEALKEMTNNTNNTIIDTLKAMQDEFKLAITQLTQQNSPIETGTTAESVTELLNSKLDVMIDKLSQSNDTQDKLLQYSKV